jgi:DNA polymerase-1
MPEIIRSLIETHKEGYEIEEVDLSQLELVAAAALSKDVQLIYDLTHGVDIHFNTASKVFGADKAKAKRKLAKNVNFGVLYGGSANGLSKQTGVPSKTIQELIDAFYERYPDVLQWQDDLFETVIDCGYPYDIKQGEQRYAYDYVIPNSGKKITFVEVESPPWMNTKYSFSPTHTSNYPIQGFAGGDIVMQLLYWLWRNTSSTVRFLLTVHDSIIMEKPEDEDLTHVYDQAMREISTCLKLPVPITYDVEAGPTWR